MFPTILEVQLLPEVHEVLFKDSQALDQPNSRRTCFNDGKYHTPEELFWGYWGAECQQAFGAIIDKLTSSPVLT